MKEMISKTGLPTKTNYKYKWVAHMPTGIRSPHIVSSVPRLIYNWTINGISQEACVIYSPIRDSMNCLIICGLSSMDLSHGID